MDDAGHRFRWVVFGGLCGLYFGFGVIVSSIAPLVTTMRIDLGIGSAAFGLALGAWPFVYIVTAPPAGWMLDRIGLARAMAIGGVVIAISGALRAGADGLATLWLAIGVFGFGGPLISAGGPKVVATWFVDDRERRIALASYTAAPALGTFMTLLLTNSVLMPWLDSWRAVLLLDAAVMVVAVAAWMVISLLAPDPPVRADEPATTAERGVWKMLLRARGVQHALVVGLALFFFTHGLQNWFPTLLEEHSGFSTPAASNWAAGAGAVSLVAAATIPRRADRERAPLIMRVVLVLVTIALIGILVLPRELDPFPILLLGIRSALVPIALLMLLEVREVTAANAGMANGLWFSFAEIGGVTGPLAVGVLADTSAGFGGVLVLLVGVCALLFLLIPAGGRGSVSSTR